MIITIIFLVITLLGIVSIILYNKYDIEDLGLLGTISIITGIFCLSLAIIVIVVSHITAPRIIQENKLKYDGLCKRYEIIKSEYEDVSKSDVISDITEWNIEVYKIKYWTDNPWTNWFHPKKIANNLNYIPLDS